MTRTPFALVVAACAVIALSCSQGGTPVAQKSRRSGRPPVSPPPPSRATRPASSTGAAGARSCAGRPAISVARRHGTGRPDRADRGAGPPAWPPPARSRTGSDRWS
ncbi:MAG: hypothetical protein MZU95_07420 [Desulfomicrobium escambiense]|nr:hypothetical protein [Desulfomicrobium escambiense]